MGRAMGFEPTASKTTTWRSANCATPAIQGARFRPDPPNPSSIRADFLASVAKLLARRGADGHFPAHECLQYNLASCRTNSASPGGASATADDARGGDD